MASLLKYESLLEFQTGKLAVSWFRAFQMSLNIPNQVFIKIYYLRKKFRIKIFFVCLLSWICNMRITSELGIWVYLHKLPNIKFVKLVFWLPSRVCLDKRHICKYTKRLFGKGESLHRACTCVHASYMKMFMRSRLLYTAVNVNEPSVQHWIHLNPCNFESIWIRPTLNPFESVQLWIHLNPSIFGIIFGSFSCCGSSCRTHGSQA